MTASATDVRFFAVTIISTLPFRALSGADRSCLDDPYAP
jgi:hypothetical protein